MTSRYGKPATSCSGLAAKSSGASGAGRGKPSQVEARRAGVLRIRAGPLEPVAARGDRRAGRRRAAAPPRRSRPARPPDPRSPTSAPSARATSRTTSQSGRAAPGGGSGGPHALDAPLGVGEGAVLLQPRPPRAARGAPYRAVSLRKRSWTTSRSRRGEGAPDAALVGVALGEVLALRPERAQLAPLGRGDHPGHREPGPLGRRRAPQGAEARADRRVVELLIAGDEVRHAPHVGAALDVVLPAQREHPGPRPPDAAGEQAEVDERAHRVHALGQLRQAQAVDEERRARAQHARRPRPAPRDRRSARAEVRRGVPGEQVGGERLEPGGPLRQVGAVDRAALQERPRQGVQQRDVGAGGQRRWTVATAASSVRRGSITISGVPPQRRLEDARAHDRVRLGRVRAGDHDGARLLDVVEAGAGRPRARGRAQGRGGGGMADPGAAVDVVGAQDRHGPASGAGSRPRWSSATRRAPRGRRGRGRRGSRPCARRPRRSRSPTRRAAARRGRRAGGAW